MKIRCSASIYDIYWQSTEVSFEEDRAPPKVIQYQPAATIVGIDYLQPPPNFQTGQKKPDGHVGVKGKKRIFAFLVFFLFFLRERRRKRRKFEKDSCRGGKGVMVESDNRLTRVREFWCL